MNERTKAIGRQAGLVFIEDGVYGQRWYSSKCGLDVSEYEKLVELIVAECVAIAQSADDDSWKLDGKGTEIARNIQQHFGVER